MSSSLAMGYGDFLQRLYYTLNMKVMVCEGLYVEKFEISVWHAHS
jgi:hypothetical protein